MTQIGPALLRYMDATPGRKPSPETMALLAILDDLWRKNQELASRLYRLEHKGQDE